jgi:4-hydroxy-2-oxoheptanedioate aldolase
LFDRFEEMISLPGVDAVVIGPRDLSLNMGFPDGPNHPEVQEMIDRVVAICQKSGVAAGITAGSRADSAAQVVRGAMMILAIAQLVITAGSQEFLPEPS